MITNFKIYENINLKEYILLKTDPTSILDYVIIKTENTFKGKFGRSENTISMNMKKIYEVEKGTLRKVKNGFYFSWEIEKIEKNMVYQSNNIDDVKNKLSLILTANKYNI